jgi:hypothetical protein
MLGVHLREPGPCLGYYNHNGCSLIADFTPKPRKAPVHTSIRLLMSAHQQRGVEGYTVQEYR